MAEEKKTDDKTIKDVVDSMSEEQKNVMYFLIGEALKNAEKNEETVKHSDEGGEEEMKHTSLTQKKQQTHLATTQWLK